MRTDLAALRDRVESKLRSGSGPAEPVTQRHNDRLKQLSAQALTPQAEATRNPSVPEGREVLAAVNWWWQEPLPRDRNKLRSALERLGVRAAFYSIADVQRALSDADDPTLLFRPSEDQGGWLWHQPEGVDYALVIPADPRYFQGDMMALVSRLFEIAWPSREPSFARVFRACQLRAAHGSTDRYTILKPGVLQLRGQPEPNAPMPPSFEELVAVHEASTAHVKSAPSETFPDLVISVLERFNESLRQSRDQLAYVTGSIAKVKDLAGGHEQIVTTLRASMDQLGQRLDHAEDDFHTAIAALQVRRSEPAPAVPAAPSPVPTPPLVTAERHEAPQAEAKVDSGAIGALEAWGRAPQVPLKPGESAPAAGFGGSPSGTKRSTRAQRASASATSPSDRAVLEPAALQKAIQTAYALSGDQPGAKEPDHLHYQRRLIALHAELAQAAQTHGVQATIELVHLNYNAETLQLHHARRVSEGSQTLACESCGLSGTESFQLFVVIRSVADPEVKVFMPLGTFSRSGYPRGYQLLLEQVPEKMARIERMTSPALLRLVVGAENQYAVSQRMQIEYSAVVDVAAEGLPR